MKEEEDVVGGYIMVTQVTHDQPRFTMKKDDERACGWTEMELKRQNGAEVQSVPERSIRGDLAEWKIGEKEREMRVAALAVMLTGEAQTMARLRHGKNGVSYRSTSKLLA